MQVDRGLSDGGIWHPTGRGTIATRAAYASIEQRGARLAPGYGAAALDPALFRLHDVMALPIPGDWRFLTGDGHLVLGGVAVWPARVSNPRAPLEERVFRVELGGMPAAVEELGSARAYGHIRARKNQRGAVGKGMAASLVPDALWAIIEPLIPPEPPKPKGGRPRLMTVPP